MGSVWDGAKGPSVSRRPAKSPTTGLFSGVQLRQPRQSCMYNDVRTWLTKPLHCRAALVQQTARSGAGPCLTSTPPSPTDQNREGKLQSKHTRLRIKSPLFFALSLSPQPPPSPSHALFLHCCPSLPLTLASMAPRSHRDAPSSPYRTTPPASQSRGKSNTYAPATPNRELQARCHRASY